MSPGSGLILVTGIPFAISQSSALKIAMAISPTFDKEKMECNLVRFGLDEIGLQLWVKDRTRAASKGQSIQLGRFKLKIVDAALVHTSVVKNVRRSWPRGELQGTELEFLRSTNVGGAETSERDQDSSIEKWM